MECDRPSLNPLEFCGKIFLPLVTEVINNVHSELTTSSRFACLTDSKKEIRDKLYS